jgi:phage tail tape-measure protein
VSDRPHAVTTARLPALSRQQEQHMSKSNPENLDPITKTPGAHPLGTGIGAAGGAAAGAAVGSAAGPLGTLAGGVVGAIAGGLAGKEIAENANPTEGGEPSEHKLGTGAGASAGALTGAAAGSVAGPVGIAAGAAIGAAAGGTAGRGAAEVVNPHGDDDLADHHLATGLGAGGGALAGAAAGAGGGPVGMAAGAAIGAVAGGAVGKGTAKVVNPHDEDRYWSNAYRDRPYYDSALSYDDYRPAYDLGYRTRASIADGTFEQAERRLSQDWAMAKGESRLTWEQAKLAARDAWDRATG